MNGPEGVKAAKQYVTKLADWDRDGTYPVDGDASLSRITEILSGFALGSKPTHSLVRLRHRINDKTTLLRIVKKHLRWVASNNIEGHKDIIGPLSLVSAAVMNIQEPILITKLSQLSVACVPKEEMAVTVWAAAALQLHPQTRSGGGMKVLMSDAALHHAKVKLPPRELRCFVWALADLSYSGSYREAFVTQLAESLQGTSSYTELASVIASASVLDRTKVPALLGLFREDMKEDMVTNHAVSGAVIHACIRAKATLPAAFFMSVVGEEGEPGRLVAALSYAHNLLVGDAGRREVGVPASCSLDRVVVAVMKSLLERDISMLSGGQVSMLMGALYPLCGTVQVQEGKQQMPFQLAEKAVNTVAVLRDEPTLSYQFSELGAHRWLPPLLGRIHACGIPPSHSVVAFLTASLHKYDYALVKATDRQLGMLLELSADAVTTLSPTHSESFAMLGEKCARMLSIRTHIDRRAAGVAIEALGVLKTADHEDMVDAIMENTVHEGESIAYAVSLLRGASKAATKPVRTALEMLSLSDIQANVRPDVARSVVYQFRRLAVNSNLTEFYATLAASEKGLARDSLMHLLVSLGKLGDRNAATVADQVISAHSEDTLTPAQAARLCTSLATSKVVAPALYERTAQLLQRSNVIATANSWDIIAIAEAFATVHRSEEYTTQLLMSIDVQDISGWEPARLEKLFGVLARLSRALKENTKLQDSVIGYAGVLDSKIEHFSVRGLASAAFVLGRIPGMAGVARRSVKRLQSLSTLGHDIDAPLASKLCRSLLSMGICNADLITEVETLCERARHPSSLMIFIQALKLANLPPKRATLRTLLEVIEAEETATWVVRDAALAALQFSSVLDDPVMLNTVLVSLHTLLVENAVEMQTFHCTNIAHLLSREKITATHTKLYAELRRIIKEEGVKMKNQSHNVKTA